MHIKNILGATAIVLALSSSHVAVGQGLHRPPMMSEQLYAVRNNELPKPGELWGKALIEAQIPGYTPHEDSSYSQTCNYSNALATLRKIRERPANRAAYQSLWAQNQDRVFSACDARTRDPVAPVRPKGKDLPQRAQSDYLYQLGSWNFYQGKYEEALSSYVQVGKMRAAPQRANASYMVVRSLAYLKKFEQAYAEIGRILEDRTLTEVHAIAGNYRFVIMSNSNYLRESGSNSVSPALALQHLRWLHGLIRIDPEKTADTPQAIADYKDAKEQLAMYFPVYEKESRAVDWWLADVPQAVAMDSPRMSAVKALAPELKLIDWMQASWAYNVFDQDWLWSLHDQENPYWKQNARIVSHAWGRWRTEHDGVWLDIAIRRVHPREALAADILATVTPWLDKPWNIKALERETPEHRAWLYTIWENAIRINLGAGNVQKAIDLVAAQPEANLLLSQRDNTFFPRIYYSSNSYEKMLRWLSYTGDTGQARSALAAVQKIYPHGFRKWSSLLATSAAQANSAGMLVRETYGYSWAEGASNDPSVWEAMVDDLPQSALYDMALNTNIELRYRALMARAILTRALLLGAENTVVDKYAALAAKLNPYLREQILAALAKHNKGDYVSFLLKMPRFRPMAFLDYSTAIDSRTGDMQKESLAFDAIDRFNHNDNNWWCRFDADFVKERVWKRARITPVVGELFGSEAARAEFEPYLEKQRIFLSLHPYRDLVDSVEVEALERIPAGPKFLSETVIARELSAGADSGPDERNARAADLHRAVRTTRYGCKRDGTHEEYSRDAFKLLQSRYADTPWAKATPYWFK